LTADREAAAVTNTAIAIDGLESLEVARNLAAEVAFENPLMLGDKMEDLVELLFRKILRPHVRVQARFFNKQVSTGRTDAVDITEGIRDFFLRGDVDAEETRHDV
jgi:hypothetical protein